METRMIARGGATLDQIWELDEVHHVLREGKWDYVVLQEHSQLGTVLVDGVQQLNEPEGFWDTIRMYEFEIRRIRAKTVLFLTWARKRDPSQQASLNYAYMTIAQELGLIVAPVGMAWAKVRDLEPDMPLHLGDGTHPSAIGSYLSACVLADTLLGRRLVSLPARVMGHPISTAERVDMSRTGVIVNLPPERVFTNVDKYGNTSSASIPLALSAMIERGEVGSGSPVLLLGFGAGISYAAQVITVP